MSIRLTLDVLATERPALRYQPDRVRLTARGIPDGMRAGSVVIGVARLLPPLGPLRPGSYDFAFESYFDGIGANGFYYRDPTLVAWPTAPPLAVRFDAIVENARLRLAERIRSHIGGAEGEIAAALVAGGQTAKRSAAAAVAASVRKSFTRISAPEISLR